MSISEIFDVVVVGGGPSGATAAHDLANLGRTVLLLDRAGRIKPCGGAIPPRLIRDFDIPDHLLVARVNSARMVSPSDKQVDMPIDGGFVGMVDRDVFDEWLRERAAAAGAKRRTGLFKRFERDEDGKTVVYYDERAADGSMVEKAVRTRALIGADGALSAVARQCLPGADRLPYVFAYHEIVRSPPTGSSFDGTRCDVYYRGTVSPDFYGWIFPHGDTVSVGTGSRTQGIFAARFRRRFAGCCRAWKLRDHTPRRRTDSAASVAALGRRSQRPAGRRCRRCRGAGVGRRHLLRHDRWPVVGGSGRSVPGDRRREGATRSARKRFMRMHGVVFWILGVMQWYWYSNDRRRERFVSICRDRDVQKLTWDAYMNKELVRAKPIAHVRIFFKNLAHMAGLASA